MDPQLFFFHHSQLHIYIGVKIVEQKLCHTDTFSPRNGTIWFCNVRFLAFNFFTCMDAITWLISPAASPAFSGSWCPSNLCSALILNLIPNYKLCSHGNVSHVSYKQASPEFLKKFLNISCVDEWQIAFFFLDKGWVTDCWGKELWETNNEQADVCSHKGLRRVSKLRECI